MGLGPGLRNTESDSAEHAREIGVVIKAGKASLTRFGKLKLEQPVAFNGPFEWVAVKSKYFVTALFVPDTRSDRDSTAGSAAPPPSPSDTADEDDRPARRCTAGIQVKAERVVPIPALCRADGVPPAPGHRPRLRRRQPVRVARLPHHHPPGGAGRPIAAGLDARQPGARVRSRPHPVRHPDPDPPLAAQPEGHALQHGDAGGGTAA